MWPVVAIVVLVLLLVLVCFSYEKQLRELYKENDDLIEMIRILDKEKQVAVDFAKEKDYTFLKLWNTAHDNKLIYEFSTNLCSDKVCEYLLAAIKKYEIDTERINNLGKK